MRIATAILLLFFMRSAVAQNYGWYPVPGAPQSTRFDDINFIHDSVAWIGKRDTIYKTTDRGLTWNVVYADD
jgi:photosystem II stability/assembly factor-like uncharacterized protein